MVRRKRCVAISSKPPLSLWSLTLKIPAYRKLDFLRGLLPTVIARMQIVSRFANESDISGKRILNCNQSYF